MIIAGTTISSTDIKVGGMFIDGTKVVTITATTPPNPITTDDGKTAELHLNTSTGELYWLELDRPLTDAERVTALEAQNAQMVLALVQGGLM